MTAPVRYTETLPVRCSPTVSELVDQAAARQGVKPAEWLRRAVAFSLRADGFGAVLDGARAE